MYLFYVKKAFNLFEVYRCDDIDPFHTMGEMIYRSIIHVERIDFVECTDQRLKYWEDNKQKILTWVNKYKVDK